MTSPTGLMEFGPLTPDEKPQGYSFSFSKLFRRAVKGSSGSQNSSEERQTSNVNNDSTSAGSSSGTPNHPLGEEEEDDVLLSEKVKQSTISECSDVSSTTSSVTSLLTKIGPSSAQDRNLPNVITRLKNIIDNRGSTPQQYKDSDFKQYWMPDSVSRECYECEEKFTTFRRRHHCRVCGQIFCSRCCNRMIPGKVIGYTGELRVCTYCCKVVLSYIQSNNLAADLTEDLRALQEDLQHPTGWGSANSSGESTGNGGGNHTPLATPRGTLRRRPSLGFQEERYATRNRFPSGEYPVYSSQREDEQMTAERQLLLRDSQQLQTLWSQLIADPSGIHLGSHRHRLKSFNDCFVGRDLVQWLIVNDKASSKASAVAIGQALLEVGYIVCISQPEQVFVADYVLYRPLRPSDGSEETMIPQANSQRYEGGQEPLWFKQITVCGNSSENYQDPQESLSTSLRKEESRASVDTISSLTSSSSNYCLDLNLQDNVVSVKKPQESRPKNTVDSKTRNTDWSRESPPSGDNFSTTVSAALSATAQLTQGTTVDGTSSAWTGPLMTEEVLKALRGHEGNLHDPPSSGWQQESQLSADDQEVLMRQRLNALWSSHEGTLLRQLLDSAGLSPSWADVIQPIIHTVTEIIRPDVRNDDDDMDIRQYIQVKKVPGGSRTESEIVNGAVCTKNVTDKQMAVPLTNPQILCIASTIDYQRGNDTKLLSFDNLLLQEADYLKNVVAKIVSYNPSIILVEKSIAFLAREFLQAHNIVLVMNMKPAVMERVARCTQAEIVSSIDAQLTRPVLGMCHNFYLKTYQVESKSKTLMFFDGCATHLGCTIILRGASNAELKRVKRIMYFMIYAVYNWRLERSYIMDEFALIPPLPSESFELDDQVFEERTCNDGTGVDTEEQIETESEEMKEVDSADSSVLNAKENNGDVNPNQSVKMYQNMEFLLPPDGKYEKNKIVETISDFSDPLHSYLNAGTSPSDCYPMNSPPKALAVAELPFSNTFRKALDDNILSCTPYMRFNVPYLETEVGRNCHLRSYFSEKIYFSSCLEKEKAVRRPRFSEKEGKEVRDENENVEIRPVHEFIVMKITKDARDKDFRAKLADFRARGGQYRNICQCEKEICCEDRSKEDMEVQLDGQDDWSQGSSTDNLMNNSNTAGLILLRDGNVDALHPFNHQHLSILFSSYSQAPQSPPHFCVNPWVLTMDFYGRNDIPLGAFLERYCFSPTYTCPSSDCSVAMVDHVRKFAHESGCVEVLLRKLETVLDEASVSTILMWSWCRVCREVSPVVPMSHDTWSLSFAKYLELRFHGFSLCRRGAPSCNHSLHHDHFQYFGFKNLVAIFKYNSVTLREIALPPPAIVLEMTPISQSAVVEEIKQVAVQGYSVFSTILERIASLSAECGSRWKPFITELSEHQKEQRVKFREMIENIQLQLTSPTLESRRLHPPTPGTVSEVMTAMTSIADQVILIRRLIVQVVNEWNEKVQSLLQLRKKEEKLEKAKLTSTPSSSNSNKHSSSSFLTSSIVSGTISAMSPASSTTSDAVTAKTTLDTLSSSSSISTINKTSDGDSISCTSVNSTNDLGEQISKLQANESGSDIVDGTIVMGQDKAGCDSESNSLKQSDSKKNEKEDQDGAVVAALPSLLLGLQAEKDGILTALGSIITSTTTTIPTPSPSLHPSLAAHHTDGSTEPTTPSSESNRDNESDVTGGLQAAFVNQAAESHTILHRRQVSDSGDALTCGGCTVSGSPGRGHERSLSDGGQVGMGKEAVVHTPDKRYGANTVKNIISTFWSSSANLLVESPFGSSEHHILLPEVRVPVVVYGDEPSSIIAHALASQLYDEHLINLKKNLKENQKESVNASPVNKRAPKRVGERDKESSITMPMELSSGIDLKKMTERLSFLRSVSGEKEGSHQGYQDTSLSDQESWDEPDFALNTSGDAEKSKSTVGDPHIELQWRDQHAKFYCKIFFAEQFRRLRKMVFPLGEDHFIRSLSRCVLWEARGGKSGSVFCKSHDDRFILKEMSRFEMTSFLDFGPAYIQHIVNCERERRATVLTRIVGVYRIGYKNTTINKAQRMDVLVMENLFYKRNITHKFDLKGSIRNRLVSTSGKEGSEIVLLDENLLRRACSSPLYVRPHSKTIITQAINSDTSFLSQQLIMDYSLLVGIDEEAEELVVGIIDYIRTFTWDKKLETIIKGSVLGGGAGKLPTVVSPELYRTRFCHAMERYFLLVPDRWSGLGVGIDG
ncbi:1-phosphatidylinositol 3-phosphate 5-kinase fab1 isoform X3 [Oratosquilla oratoria]|uniref:1-phosphatidylinositol 3-phosphate 5-kinase fab1 isoform X3 n=1 Tax=Oratosquilla oratoria TaxID=337810 RepID=UPI003F767A4D